MENIKEQAGASCSVHRIQERCGKSQDTCSLGLLDILLSISTTGIIKSTAYPQFYSFSVSRPFA